MDRDRRAALMNQSRKMKEAERARRLAMPIHQIHNKPFHRIPISEINPYFGRELVSTTYVLGSPGSGKSRFLLRLRDETSGKLVLESGVFDLFQRYVVEYVRKKQSEGKTGSIDFSDLDFDMPNIDGLAVHDNLVGGLEQEATPHNALYSGIGASHYRCFLVDISSGGKSGYPDWLFVSTSDSQYVQIISFPGHRNIAASLGNKSIPDIPPPDNVIYLVDPDIQAYHHANWKTPKNPALDACGRQLSDVLYLEGKGITAHWFLSKTNVGQLEEHRQKSVALYSGRDFEEIARRIPGLDGFDSFDSSREELYQKVGQFIGIY